MTEERARPPGPRAPTARQRQGAASRERILDAAEALVAERGYAATSISQIATASGLPASSIYWHFSSKAELLAAVVERGAQRWLVAQPRWSSFDGDLDAFVEAVGKSVDERPAFLQLFFLLVLEGRETSPARARDLAQTVWHRVRTGLERVFAEALAPDEGPGGRRRAARMARFTMACIDGVFVDAHIDPEGTDVEELVAALGVALHALAAEPDDPTAEPPTNGRHRPAAQPRRTT